MRNFSRVSLAVAASAVLVGSLALPASADDTTTTTASIAAGSIEISAPTSAALSALTPGGTATANLNGVQVSDNRAGVEGWTASVVLSDFTGQVTGDVIEASFASYATGEAGVVGTASVLEASAADLSVPTAVQTATAVTGNNTATWNAVINLSAPTDALADDYSAILTHSLL